MAPRTLIAGNWKMNGLGGDGLALARAVAQSVSAETLKCDVLICPPATLLREAKGAIVGTPVALGAQDCHADAKGAHTGDIAAEMLKDCGCGFVIVGHSERRTDHGETDARVRTKAEAAHRAGLTAIVCIGETLQQRDAGQAIAVVTRQLAASVPDGANAANTVIAYEPVWAIGTGRTPTNPEIGEVHGRIRAELTTRFRDGAEFRILYGGSVNAKNAAEILRVAHVNGGLVGGASLDAQSFLAICRSAV
jgi:triosephosphate isomerase